MTSILLIDRQATAGRPYVKLILCFTIAICATPFALPTRVVLAESPRLALSVSWRLLDNLPDEHFKSEITLRYNGKAPLANNWALYFNCGRKLIPKSVGTQFDLTH